jgi:hypothetical protein
MHPNHALPRCGLALTLGVTLASPALAVESFRKLNDAEIRARLAGMETTDGVHWAEQYMRDGTFKMFFMGKLTQGKWSVRKGTLRLDDGKPDPEPLLGCKEVWLSRNKVEFRVPGSGLLPFDAQIVTRGISEFDQEELVMTVINFDGDRAGAPPRLDPYHDRARHAEMDRRTRRHLPLRRDRCSSSPARPLSKSPSRTERASRTALLR